MPKKRSERGILGFFFFFFFLRWGGERRRGGGGEEGSGPCPREDEGDLVRQNIAAGECWVGSAEPTIAIVQRETFRMGFKLRGELSRQAASEGIIAAPSLPNVYNTAKAHRTRKLMMVRCVDSSELRLVCVTTVGWKGASVLRWPGATTARSNTCGRCTDHLSYQ